MGETTAIAWTDHTFNPWWGCSRVSPGCLHCYAETFAKRTGHDVWGANGERRMFGDKHWNEPVHWNELHAPPASPGLVFCASMADVFEDHPALHEPRARLWDLVDRTPNLIWQLLTKRPENIRRFGPSRRWPSNVWLGTTVEDQQRADGRIGDLLDSSTGACAFLSCEPLLGPVNLERWIGWLDWVIVGGESGNGYRPLNMGDARGIVEQCESYGVPVFFKQVGGRTPTAGGDQLDGRVIKQFPNQAQR